MQNDSNKPLFYLLTTFTIFGIAMAYLESTIVVYLRLLYYPDGFRLPMKSIPNKIALIEIGREAATIVMLWFVARMAARDFKTKFSLFLFTFGVWDLFYYFWLKVFLDWPGGWLDWDILFLIPLPWIGPWSAPALVSIGFICVAPIIIGNLNLFGKYIFPKKTWFAVICGAAIILVSFFWQSSAVMDGQVPSYYPWWLFGLGYLLGIMSFILYWRKQTAGPRGEVGES